MESASHDGIVIPGHGVASGRGGDPRFPDGTIALQVPHFRRIVPDLDAYLGAPAFAGTINLRIPGHHPRIMRPEHHIAGLRWTDAFPPENFFLSRAVLARGGQRHPAFLYVPDPATKPDHPQPSDVIELIAAPIPGLVYGERLTLFSRPAEVRFDPAG